MTKQDKRCEGFERHGGAFSFGPITWVQCKRTAIVTLNVIQDGKESIFRACASCWKQAKNTLSIKITDAEPIIEVKK